MHYFSHITHTLALKNKLEKAVTDFLHEKERLVIDEKDIPKFISDVLLGIDRLCEVHNRCKPIKASFWKPSRNKNDLHLSDVGFCVFHLYASKN